MERLKTYELGTNCITLDKINSIIDWMNEVDEWRAGRIPAPKIRLYSKEARESIDKQLEDILEDCFGEYLKIHGLPFKDRKINDAKTRIKSVCGIKED